MAYKKFNLYEGVKITERVLTTAILIGLAALAIIILAFAGHGNEEKINDERIPFNQSEKSHSRSISCNTQNLIK